MSDDEPVQTSRGPSLLPCVGALLALVLLGGGAAMLALRASRPPLDTVLTFRFQPWPKEPAVTADAAAVAVEVARARLDGLGVPFELAAASPQELKLRLPWGELGRAKDLLAQRGDLRFCLVEEHLSPIQVADLAKAKEDGTYDASHARWNLYPQLEDGKPLVVRERTTQGERAWLEVGVQTAGRGLDGAGRPCVAMTLDARTAKAFYELTSQNVGMRLAIVLDDVVLTAPSIRSAIGERLIIEGGNKGWSEEELRSLIYALQPGGPLPVQLVPAGEAREAGKD
ncbi:MAG: hypothetical protein AB7N76_19285 [Planctomycetota bacterium]